MDLARSLLQTASGAANPPPVRLPMEAPERTLLDLVAVQLREALGVPSAGQRVVVTRAATGAEVLRVARADQDGMQADLQFSVEIDDAQGWLRVVSSAGDMLQMWAADVHPAPVEIAHLRVRAWLDRLLQRGRHGLPESAQVRGLFVLGVPRSGTTMLGNWLGSHPAVLGLAEYGGFYIAHSVAPAYVNRLPGRRHAPFLDALQRLAVIEASTAARRRGCAWFCDATPWNLQVADAIARAVPDAVFVLMLRHFSGAVLSLRQFHWAGNSWADVARLWVSLNECITQLPEGRTIVVGYDVLAAEPASTVETLREALRSLGLDKRMFDDTQFAASHAHVVGKPRPTVASVVAGQVVFHPIPSLDDRRWTPDVQAEVWPVVARMHAMLLDRFPGVYVSPRRPDHVPESQW